MISNNYAPQVRLSEIINCLPKLPSTVRYYDDFEDKSRTIRNLQENKWLIQFNGEDNFIDFSMLESSICKILKHVAIDLIYRLSPVSAYRIMRAIIRKRDPFIQALLLTPEAFRELWITDIKATEERNYTQCLRDVVHSLCNLSIGTWTPELNSFVSLLESPSVDLYKTVRLGECFIPLDHQALIIEYLHDISRKASDSSDVLSSEELRNACILALSHQFGLRPGQISRIKIPDVRCFKNGAIHISFPQMKQRGDKAMRLASRRISDNWLPIFSKYTGERNNSLKVRKGMADSYFGSTPREVSLLIHDITEEITGERWGPMDLRHTAAQQLVNAGISHISLAEFMGHATTLSANVYFDTSPSQAEKINQALALSPSYSLVSEVARTRSINKEALLELPADNQIGGVPHGIPISGIGGCSMGQSLCAKNPILSCYTCRKFLPIRDAAVHESVVENLRSVVKDFASASRNNEESPSYTQLRIMLEAATQIAKSVKIISADGGMPGNE